MKTSSPHETGKDRKPTCACGVGANAPSRVAAGNETNGGKDPQARPVERSPCRCKGKCANCTCG